MDPFDPAERAALTERARALVCEQRMATAYPPRFWSADLASVRAVHGDEVWQALTGWCSSPGAGLLLLGPTGTGKTWASAAVARALAPSMTVRYGTAASILAALRPDGALTFRTFAASGLLVIDDVGAERLTDWAAEQLTSIIDDRWTHARPTLVTSNLSTPDLVEHLGARSWSRLTGADSIALRLGGVDHRRDLP